MGEALTSRELFKSYGTSRDLPLGHTYYGIEYNPKKPEKNWFDTYLQEHPDFIGKVQLISPQGRVVLVTYGKTFVEYPYGIEWVEGQIIPGRLILTREDAVLFNIVATIEGKGVTPSDIPPFRDIPWDRPLESNEVISSKGPMAFPMIYSVDELVTPEVKQNDTLARIEAKLDQLLAR
jgi:hypothetical protein